MTLHVPFIITARLLPGVKVGDHSFISIEFDGVTEDRRYRYHLDTPDFEFSQSDLKSGVGGDGLQAGMESLLDLLGAAGDSWKANGPGDADALFPDHVAEWAYQQSEELALLRCELQEHPGLITD
jgi:hypothetical protein